MINQIDCTWTDEYKLFDWIETFVIDEVPLDDLWENFSTKLRLELDKFHRSKGVVKESTKHYMSFAPVLPLSIEPVLEQFAGKTYSFNFLKLQGSFVIPMHYDSYSTFVKRNNVDKSSLEKIHRTVIMMTPWASGQVLQIRQEVFSNWQPGTTYTWKGLEWHGAANFGFDDLVVMQITWI
jgi:hypothetical protein